MSTLKECKITPKKIECLNKIGVTDSNSLLAYYPARYDNMQSEAFSNWKINDTVIFEGKVITRPKSIRAKGKLVISKFQVETTDILDITIFNRPWISTQVQVGDNIVIAGKYNGTNKVTASQYNKNSLDVQLGLKPVYSLKEGLTQKVISELIRKALDNAVIENDIPEDIMQAYRLLNKKEALTKIHFPQNMNDVESAKRTLKYEEFLKFFMSIQFLRQNETKEFKKGKVFDVDEVYRLVNTLPFALTKDQLSTINDIIADLQSNKVMYRLVQGDVGCGKTLVCAIGMAACALAHEQAALLAPTEILAKQHYETLRKLYRPLDLKVEVLYSALPAYQKKDILENLAKGEIDIVVGTHSLIQDDVAFKKLGMVVADEQQRFGVEQRKKLVNKGDMVDFLLMSATPIPRTLANTVYGDMDISTIETMPNNRKKVETYLIEENSIKSILDRMLRTIYNKQQIYVICASIEENEETDTKSVEVIYESVKKAFSSVCKVDMLHGKMSSEEKEAIIKRFEAKESMILVSTTVVEVGINVVDATMMIIYDAHRFGLSQLHQLRGRVQRGSHQGCCYLLTDKKDEESLERLNVLVNNSNGFDISLEDLRIRGPGDILGTRQSGVSGFILGNILTDGKIMNTAKKDAAYIMEHRDKYKEFIKKIEKMNEKNMIYID